MFAVGYTRDAQGRFVDRHVSPVVGAVHTWEQTGNTQKKIMVINEKGMGNDSAPHGIRQEGSQSLRGSLDKPHAQGGSGTCPEAGRNFRHDNDSDKGQFNSNNSMNITKEIAQQYKLPPELEGRRFRIRKLTPTECFRLMDVDEDKIRILTESKDEKGKQAISNTQLYKLAGNSIVVACMEKMFRNLFFAQEKEIVEGDLTTLW